MQEDQEQIPRFRIMLQDGTTGVQVSAGTDNLALFTKTDLMKFVRHFKKQIKAIEDAWEEEKKANEPDPWPTKSEEPGAKDPSSDIQSGEGSGPLPDEVPHQPAGPGDTSGGDPPSPRRSRKQDPKPSIH